MGHESLDELLDRLVAEYSDRRRSGLDLDREGLLAQVPDEHRPALDRCLSMIDVGLASAPTTSDSLPPGAEVAGYRVDRFLGRGGVATVYAAHDPSLQRDIALKILRPALAADPRQVERFRREALAVAKLNHPHIVQVFAVGESEGSHYIAMELVDGPCLGRLLERLAESDGEIESWVAEAGGPHGFEGAIATWLAQAARAVAAAHEVGILHRDLKPSNILIDRRGNAKVADFGLAKEGGDPALSLTGEPVGTPFYMSPEQVEQHSHQVDTRTDVYSLGVTLYECLAGRRPFGGPTLFAIFDAIRSETALGLRQVAPTRSLDAEAVARVAMAKDPAHRYESADALAEDLERLARGESTQARAGLGGRGRRAWSGLKRYWLGQVIEYRSARTLLGWPLVHVCSGPRISGRPWRRAKGWLAIGDVAVGGIAISRTVAVGGIAIAPAVALGGLSLAGGVTLGLVALAGGVALGALGLAGGVGAGYVGFGGFAAGKYAVGGAAYGEHVISGRRVDDTAVEWFQENLPWLMAMLPELPK